VSGQTVSETRSLEALFFVSDEPLSAAVLAQALDVDRRTVEALCDQLAVELEAGVRGRGGDRRDPDDDGREQADGDPEDQDRSDDLGHTAVVSAQRATKGLHGGSSPFRGKLRLYPAG